MEWATFHHLLDFDEKPFLCFSRRWNQTYQHILYTRSVMINVMVKMRNICGGHNSTVNLLKPLVRFCLGDGATIERCDETYAILTCQSTIIAIRKWFIRRTNFLSSPNKCLGLICDFINISLCPSLKNREFIFIWRIYFAVCDLVVHIWRTFPKFREIVVVDFFMQGLQIGIIVQKTDDILGIVCGCHFFRVLPHCVFQIRSNM